mmetsp:Transcript_19406/g.48596  ORF Transcript_19406/g.48596 Transcript_19406/m.48596 type:complete len:476 (-) Transcript_19406:983-2410(-)
MGRRRLFAARLLPLLPLLAGGDSRGGGPVHQLLFARVATFLVGPPVSERLSLSSSSSSSTTWGALGIVEKVARKQTSLRATPREVEVEEQGDSYTEVTEEGDLYSEFSDEAYEEEHDADAGDHLPRMYYNFDATTTSTSRAGDDPEDELEQPREQEDESTLLQEQGLPCCAPPLPPPAAPAPTSSADSLRRQASRQTSQIGATAVTNYRTVAPASAASLKVKGAGGGARDVDELVDAGGTRNIMLESCRGGKAIGVAAVTADHEKCRKNMDWEDDSEHPEEAERQRKAACHPEHLSNCADRVHKGHFAHCTIDEKIAAFKHKFPACDHDKDKHGKYQVPLDYARCFEEVLCGLYGRAKRYDWNSTWTSDKDNDFPDPGEVAFKFRDWNWEDTSEAFRHFEDSGDVHDADPDAYHGCRKTCRGCSNDTHLDIDGSDPMNNHVHKRKHDDPRISDTLDHGELGCLCTPIGGSRPRVF